MHAQEHVVISLFLCQLLFLIVSRGQVPTTTAQTSSISMSASTANSSLMNDTTSTATTPTTSTVSTTTARPTADVKYNTDIARYTLVLSMSQDNSTDIRYNNASLTREDLQIKLSRFFPFSSGVSVDQDPSSMNYTLTVFFLLNKITNSSRDTMDDQIRSALRNMTDSRPAEFFLPDENITFTKVDAFASALGNVCAAANICPLGFNCNIVGCQHMCATKDCSGHGTCFISVSRNATVTSMCKCDDEYANEYTGDNCEYSKRGRYQIIAIIAAVLGSACLVFIIIIIILCVWRGRGKSSANYNFTTASYHTNNAYDNSRDK